MRITPLDVRKQEFRRVVRGCDADEVNAFLSTVADEYEAVLRDNKQLRERILRLEEKVGEYEHIEKTLRDTLMTAERVMSETKEGARKEGELIVKEAEIRAKQALEAFHQEADALRREILALQREKDGFLARFRSIAEAQIQFVDNHSIDEQEMDRRLQGISDRAGAVPARPQPVADAPPEPAPPMNAPIAPIAPIAPAAPPVEPQVSAPEPAPVFRRTAPTEHDEWRDYTPGADAAPENEQAAADGAAGPAVEWNDSEPGSVEERTDEIVEMVRNEGDESPAGERPAGETSSREEEVPVAVAAESGSDENDGRFHDQDSFTRGLMDV